jgi:hypothetical protein
MKFSLMFLVIAFSAVASADVKVVDLFCNGTVKGTIGKADTQVAAIVQRAFPSGNTSISVSVDGRNIVSNESASLNGSYMNRTLDISGYESKNAKISIVRPRISYETTSYTLTVNGNSAEVDCTEYRLSGTR